MKALVKDQAAPGLALLDVPEPEIGINDVLIRVREDRHLRHRPAHPSLGRLGAGDDPGAAGDRPRVRRRGRRGRRQRHRLRGRRPRQRRGPRRLRPLPQLHGRPPPPVRPHRAGVGVNRPGAFAEYVALPMTNVWHHGPGVDLEVAAIFDPLRQRRPHRARLPGARRGRADHRRRPDRPHGGRGRPPRRRPPRRRHRPQPLPARAGAHDGRDARRRSDATTDLAEVQRDARHEGGLRRRPRDVGQAGGAARDARQHGPRRPDRDARHPHRGDRDRPGTRSSSTCSRSRASTAARCTRPGTR